MPRISDEVREAALADYKADVLTLGEIGARYGISGSSVAKWAREAGIPRKKTGRKPKTMGYLGTGPGSWVIRKGVWRFVPAPRGSLGLHSMR